MDIQGGSAEGKYVLSLALRWFGVTTTGVLWGVASITRAANEIAEFAPDEEFDDLVATGNLIFAGKPDCVVAILDEGDLHTAFASDVCHTRLPHCKRS